MIPSKLEKKKRGKERTSFRKRDREKGLQRTFHVKPTEVKTGDWKISSRSAGGRRGLHNVARGEGRRGNPHNPERVCKEEHGNSFAHPKQCAMVGVAGEKKLK